MELISHSWVWQPLILQYNRAPKICSSAQVCLTRRNILDTITNNRFLHAPSGSAKIKINCGCQFSCQERSQFRHYRSVNRLAGKYGSPRVIWRPMIIDAIVINRIVYANSIAAMGFSHIKSTRLFTVGSRYWYFFHKPVLRTGSENQPNTILNQTCKSSGILRVKKVCFRKSRYFDNPDGARSQLIRIIDALLYELSQNRKT